MKQMFLLYGIVVVIIASVMSWSEVISGAGGNAWRSSSGPGSWSSGGHK